jgi:hypothetical protein
LRAYRAFATTFEALEAPFFQCKKVLLFPGHGHTINKPDLVPEEFVAEENVNYQKDMSASKGANADNRMVKTANLPMPPQEEEPSRVIQQGPLTLDPSPPTKEAKDLQLMATNDQAKLMHWHYRLGHLSFPKLKQLTLNGEIPKRACQGAASQVRRLPFRHDDKASLARQGNQGQPRDFCCNQTWRVHLG